MESNVPSTFPGTYKMKFKVRVGITGKEDFGHSLAFFKMQDAWCLHAIVSMHTECDGIWHSHK